MMLANWVLDRLATAGKCMIFIFVSLFLLQRSILKIIFLKLLFKGNLYYEMQ